jgi:hypothetical protein
MEAHQEHALRTHLSNLDEDQLSDVKAHAHAADSESHSSFQAISKWLVGIIGAVPSAGAVWKAIKVIRGH